MAGALQEATSDVAKPVARDGATWTHVAVALSRMYPTAPAGSEDSFKYHVLFVVNGANVTAEAPGGETPILTMPLRWALGPVHSRVGSATVTLA